MLLIGALRLLFFMCVFVLLTAQEGHNPTPPLPGVICTPVGWNLNGVQTHDEPCHCNPMCVFSEDENGGQTSSVQEDSHCRVWCYKDHCGCPHPEECAA